MSTIDADRYVPYECDMCGEKFFTYRDFKLHTREHLNGDNKTQRKDDNLLIIDSTCVDCGRVFRDKAQLTRHWNAAHSRFKSGLVIQSSDKNLDISDKLPVKPDHTVNECAVCGRNFKEKSQLTKHWNAEHTHIPEIKKARQKMMAESTTNKNTGSSESLGRFNCTACSREFLNKPSLQEHIKKYYNKKVYCCSHCDKRFHFRTSWKRHEECHKIERKVWQCDICQMTFTQKVNLKRHKEDNKNPCGGGNKVKIPSLSNSASNEANFIVSDEEEDDDDDDEPEAVEEEVEVVENNGTTPLNTDNTISSIDNSHIQKGEAFFSCCYCGKLFTYRSLWTRHEKEHNSSKSIVCEICGAKFARQFYLVRHRKSCMKKAKIVESLSADGLTVKNKYSIRDKTKSYSNFS